MRAWRFAGAFAWFGLTGCAGAEMALSDGTSTVPDAEQGADVPAGRLRFDVIPPDSLRDANLSATDAAFDASGALAQSFAVTLDAPVIALRLSPAADVSGVVTGYELAPAALADLPGAPVLVEGAGVSFRRPGTLDSANAVTDGLGAFSLRVPSGPGYEATIAPMLGTMPTLTTTFDVPDTGLADVAIDLGLGAPIWGRVTNDAGAALAGVAVHAEKAGVRGASVRTDGAGWYQLRVQPGDGYTVVAEGRESGLDPSIRSEAVAVDDGGVTVPFTYAALRQTAFHGRIIDPFGLGVEGALVELSSVQLDGYGLEANYVTTVETSDNGNFTTLVVPGTYRADVSPPAGTPLSALRVSELVVGDAMFELGTRSLDALGEMIGLVTDADGAPVSGAVVSAEEIGFDERSWSASTDATGLYRLAIPSNAIDLTLTPPANRSDLALTRIGGDQVDPERPVLLFQGGQLVDGEVSFGVEGDTVPVGLAVVEARDDLGRRWGLALTDAQGRFTMRVALPAD
jgi:hypothetical protein